ncbi:MAG: leucyl aminopeptidase [Deltaproteobacteria bacterium]|nr:leucyl aminopeptidase [Deltaproteobacteria bacterium]
MELKVLRKNLIVHKTECLIIGRFEGRGENPLIDEIDEVMDGLISSATKSGDFKGKLNQTVVFYSGGKLSAERILLIGLGNKREFNRDKLREASGTAASKAKKMGVKILSTTLTEMTAEILTPPDSAQTVVEGTMLSLYAFDDFKTDKKEKSKRIKLLNIVLPLKCKGPGKIEKGALKGLKLSESVYFARDLISNPGNVATPSYIAKKTRDMAKERGIKTRVLEKEDMKELGMGALLGVSRGSSEPPKLIILEYWGGKEKDQPYVLAGKAVTFDSGGISIKPSPGMEEMKTDMSGGAAAIGAVMAAASLKLPVNLIALVPATENLPGGRAYKPGDILTSMSGQTIEVLNTDAEGRLILADALTYAERFKPKAVIDIATLTGACIIALGNHASGLLGNNEGLKKELVKAGEESGEKLWELPLWEPYKKQISSDVADMKNVGGKAAGAITAAAFLDKFATKYHWAHIDIAGTAWEKKGKPFIPKGAAGVGIRLIIRYLENTLSS